MNFKSGQNPALYFFFFLFLSQLLISSQTLSVDFAPADRKQETTDCLWEEAQVAPSVTLRLSLSSPWGDVADSSMWLWQ